MQKSMSRSLRTIILPSSFAALVLTAQLGDAQAACATTDPQCSFGPATGLKGERLEGPADPVVGFAWHRDFGGGAFEVGIDAALRLVPKDDDPFFSVDMSSGERPPQVQASWGNDKIVKLSFLDSANADATFAARYGLAVQVRLLGKALGATVDKTWDVTDKLTGLGNEDFNFEASKSTTFRPWGTAAAPAEMVVAGGSIDTTRLFQISLADVGLDISCPGGFTCATGDLGMYISTEGTIFRYRTVGAKLNGASVDATQEMPLAIQPEYGDELTVRAILTGGVNIDGDLYAKPYIRLTSLYGYGPGGSRNDDGGIGWPLEYAADTLSIHEEFILPVDPAQSVTFDYPETTILIPIPNVKLQKEALSMSGKSGRISIANTGKKTARVSFATESDGFSVPGGAQDIEPGGSYELQVVYTNSDAATGEVTITTNDPDSPVMVLRVGANGASVGDPDEDLDDGSSSGRGADGIGDNAEEGGCGCTTTGGAGQTAGFAAVLGTALAALAFLRRRPRA